jgi:hypothetical protein
VLGTGAAQALPWAALLGTSVAAAVSAVPAYITSRVDGPPLWVGAATLLVYASTYLGIIATARLVWHRVHTARLGLDGRLAER